MSTLTGIFTLQADKESMLQFAFGNAASNAEKLHQNSLLQARPFQESRKVLFHDLATAECLRNLRSSFFRSSQQPKHA